MSHSIGNKERILKATLSVLLFPLSITQNLFTKWEMRKYTPMGTMVDLGTHQLHAIISGKGKPTIILNAGMGSVSLDWSFVQPELAKHATIISYDRAGLGWSTRCNEKATAEDYVNDLKNLLEKLELTPPYILVGHSFSGLIVRLFAARYPNETAGLVLVDSVHEHYYLPELMSKNRKGNFKKAIKINKLAYLFSPLGLLRFTNLYVGTKRLPLEFLKVTKALGYKTSAYKAVFLEIKGAEQSAKQVLEANKIPDSIPITIISAGKQTKEWKDQQLLLQNLNNNTKQIFAEESGHSIQIHNPDIVIEAIKEQIFKLKENIDKKVN